MAPANPVPGGEEGGGPPVGGFGPIQLTREMDTFTANIRVIGTGMNSQTILGGGQKGMFSVSAESTSSISQLTLRNGFHGPGGGGGLAGSGGSITNQGKFTLDAVRVLNSVAQQGGAIYTVGPLTVSGCEFRACQAVAPLVAGNGGMGGAIHTGSGLTTVANSKIDQNHAAARGGGIAVMEGGQVQITDTNLILNTSDDSGGGVYNSGGNFAMVRGDMIDNRSKSEGGGIFQSGGNTVLQNAHIHLNSSSKDGGGVFIGNGTLAIVDSELEGNSGVNGGGIYIKGGSVNLLRTTVKVNSASADGGGIYIEGGSVDLTTCTFDGNTAGNNGKGPKIANKNQRPVNIAPDCIGINPNDVIAV